jgi:hypothetical protein
VVVLLFANANHAGLNFQSTSQSDRFLLADLTGLPCEAAFELPRRVLQDIRTTILLGAEASIERTPLWVT